jgi:GTP-binding protein Era
MADLAKRHNFAAIVPISALKANGVEALKKTIADALPVAPAMYADDQLTESSLEFRIAEMIREKLTLELNQEVPYGVAVEVEQMKDEDGQLTVDAAIWVDREGQKPIVIGAKGERLKRVGRSARIALNDLLNRRLHLNLWVKVRENWADNARALKHLGVE